MVHDIAVQQGLVVARFVQIVVQENHIVDQDQAVVRPDPAVVLYNLKKVHHDVREVDRENHVVNRKDQIVVHKDLEVAHGVHTVDLFDRTVVHVSLVHKYVPAVVLCQTARVAKRDEEIL